LDDAVHVASVAQIYKSCLPRFWFAGDLEQAWGKWIWLWGPGTLVQNKFYLLLTRFWQVLQHKQRWT